MELHSWVLLYLDQWKSALKQMSFGAIALRKWEKSVFLAAGMQDFYCDLCILSALVLVRVGIALCFLTYSFALNLNGNVYYPKSFKGKYWLFKGTKEDKMDELFLSVEGK